ncbi:hypothetical protein DSO57_1033685 [Entomophthora muscae]|uniref:Uncharacterized protein n=1 Tax=Entomophthora muscae TaxID=34485 RepID=A0ACC2U9R5_9FUNG|nr:hypothetical protein DSO57_1033685 [Entomophthora muscae]
MVPATGFSLKSKNPGAGKSPPLASPAWRLRVGWIPAQGLKTVTFVTAYCIQLPLGYCIHNVLQTSLLNLQDAPPPLHQKSVIPSAHLVEGTSEYKVTL